MILGSGIAPIVDLSKSGIKISLGTDGAASNDSQNLMEVMKVGSLLQKVNNHDSAALSAWEVFSMATNQGAECINMQEKIGTIEVGKQADMVIIDLEKANTTPCYDPIASLVYSGSSENIATVIVNGAIIYNKGKFTHIDEVDILSRAQKKAQEIYQHSL
jgi:5-methylthioadenosine/S-adenosylhomocysteine deaminase